MPGITNKWFDCPKYSATLAYVVLHQGGPDIQFARVPSSQEGLVVNKNHTKFVPIFSESLTDIL